MVTGQFVDQNLVRGLGSDPGVDPRRSLADQTVVAGHLHIVAHAEDNG